MPLKGQYVLSVTFITEFNDKNNPTQNRKVLKITVILEGKEKLRT